MKKLFILIIMLLAGQQHGFSQTPAEKKADSTSTQPKGLQPYEKIIKEGSKEKLGLFTVNQVDTKFYFQIPDSLFNRYMLVVTRYLSTPGGIGIFGGEKANEQTIYFEKGANNTVFLRSLQYKQDVRNADSMLAKALAGSNESPIVAAFPIKTTNPVTGSVVIDVTDVFKKDNPMFSIENKEKTEKKLTSLADDKSFIEMIDAYPINIEIKTTKTYTNSTSSSGTVTLRLNTSIVLLPKTPMRKRFADERVGYFANKYVCLMMMNSVLKQNLLFSVIVWNLKTRT